MLLHVLYVGAPKFVPEGKVGRICRSGVFLGPSPRNAKETGNPKADTHIDGMWDRQQNQMM